MRGAPRERAAPRGAIDWQCSVCVRRLIPPTEINQYPAGMLKLYTRRPLAARLRLFPDDGSRIASGHSLGAFETIDADGRPSQSLVFLSSPVQSSPMKWSASSEEWLASYTIIDASSSRRNLRQYPVPIAPWQSVQFDSTPAISGSTSGMLDMRTANFATFIINKNPKAAIKYGARAGPGSAETVLWWSFEMM